MSLLLMKSIGIAVELPKLSNGEIGTSGPKLGQLFVEPESK